MHGCSLAALYNARAVHVFVVPAILYPGIHWAGYVRGWYTGERRETGPGRRRRRPGGGQLWRRDYNLMQWAEGAIIRCAIYYPKDQKDSPGLGSREEGEGEREGACG